MYRAVASSDAKSRVVEPSPRWNEVVGAGRFELLTPCSRSKCATRLRYAPPDRHDERYANAARPATCGGGVIAAVAESRKARHSAGGEAATNPATKSMAEVLADHKHVLAFGPADQPHLIRAALR